MTMRTRRAIVCECGHVGYIHTRENDQPYSAEWVRHELEGFVGNCADEKDRGDLLKVMNPRCPKCGQDGKVTYAKGT